MRRTLTPATLAFAALLSLSPAWAQGVIDEWEIVKPPAPPMLAQVSLDPKTTALLVLDLARQTCNPEQRPRCIAMLPRVQPLLAQARAKNWFVVYTLNAAAAPSDIMPAVAMLGSEPVVKGAPDKFLGTDLQKILKDHGIKTAVMIGAAAEGAVLHTAATAAFLGFDVVVPVDGMAAENAYAEQYTAWDLVNAPRLPDHVKLSAIGLIE